MEKKTTVDYEEGNQQMIVNREFDLPVELLFKAYEEKEIVEQWMSTKVLKLENKKHGSYQFETSGPHGNKHRFNGTIHDFSKNHRIIRTFEMENTALEPWIEYLEFQDLGPEKSKLVMHMVFRTVELRDQMLKMPFAQGINFAHSRLEEVVKNNINKYKGGNK